MKRILILITVLLSISFTGLQADELARHLYISHLENAAAPEYHLASNSIVFTYQAAAGRFQPRHVGISFEHERFSRIVEMQYRDLTDSEGMLISRVYFFFLPISGEIADMDSVGYRYVVDGIWIEDLNNPVYDQKISGQRVSRVNIPASRNASPVSPQVVASDSGGRSRIVRFLYHGEPGESVYLTGSFNNWDPFMYRMSENPMVPGEYRIDIRLLPGNYQYNFYYRGHKIRDPLNILSSYDIEGFAHSLVSVDS